MTNIDTLFRDIGRILQDDTSLPDGFGVEPFVGFARSSASHVANAVDARTTRPPRDPNTIYATELGTSCARQFWYKRHHPHLGERFGMNTKIKFLYGNLIEEMILLLAKVAGHEVESEQMPVRHIFSDSTDTYTISGRIDAVIDGVLIDVKSTNPHSFKSMRSSSTFPDTFGYRSQLDFYHAMVPKPDAPRFLLVDKQNGSLGWAFTTHRSITSIELRALTLFDISKDPSTAPSRPFTLEPHSKGERLGTVCSYCPFKFHCWPGLRVFSYSTGPLFLAKVDGGGRVFLDKEITDNYKKNAGLTPEEKVEASGNPPSA